MRKAIIILDSKNHEMREKSIKLNTIFGSVYAPLKQTDIKDGIAEVPEWVFHKAGINPCQMITGFVISK